MAGKPETLASEKEITATAAEKNVSPLDAWLDNMNTDLDLLKKIAAERNVRLLDNAKFSLPAELTDDLTRSTAEDLQEITAILDEKRLRKVKTPVQITTVVLEQLGQAVKNKVDANKREQHFKQIAQLGADLTLLQAFYEQKINYLEDTSDIDIEPDPAFDTSLIVYRLFESTVLAAHWVDSLKRNATALVNLGKKFDIKPAPFKGDITLEHQLLALTLRIGLNEFSPLIETSERDQALEVWQKSLLSDQKIWRELLQERSIVGEPLGEIEDEAAIQASFINGLKIAVEKMIGKPEMGKRIATTIQEVEWAGAPAVYTGKPDSTSLPRGYFASFLDDEPDAELFTWSLDAMIRQNKAQPNTIAWDTTPQLFTNPEAYEKWVKAFKANREALGILAGELGLSELTDTQLKLLALTLRLGIRGENPYLKEQRKE